MKSGDIIEKRTTSVDPYGDMLEKRNDRKSKAYRDKMKRTGKVFAFDDCEGKEIEFGSRLSAMTIELYNFILQTLDSYMAFSSYANVEEERKKLLRGFAVVFAREFVKDNRWLVKRGKLIFNDLTSEFVEKVAGNYFILATDGCDMDQIRAWFLCHYLTQTEKERKQKVARRIIKGRGE